MIPASDLIPFGEWLPDLGKYSNPGAIIAKNCLTQGEKYIPLAALIEQADALSDTCIGAFAYRDAAGNVTVFAGTRTALYKLVGTSWTDITRLDGAGPATEAYATGADGFWHFVNFGTLVIATNYNDDIQVYDMGSSSEFEQLSATAPRCRWLMVLSNFLVALDVVDGDGATGYRVKWSKINDPQGDWTPDPTVTQADFQDLYGGDYSIAAGAVLNDHAVIFQGKTIWRMQYIGGQEIFGFDVAEQGKGTTIGRSVVSDGTRVFYYSADDGHNMYIGGQSMPVGHNKIDKTIKAMIDPANYHRINAAVDSLNKIVMMAFPSVGNTSGICDLVLCYNWADERYTLAEFNTEILFSYLSSGITMDSMDSLYASLDTVPFSLDSDYWAGGKSIFGAFSENSKISSFTGDALTATIETSEARINKSGKSALHSIIPYIEGGTKTCRLALRDKLTIDPTYTEIVSPNSFTDEFDFNKEAVYMRAEMTISDDWSIAHGIALRAQTTGNV